MKVVTSQQYILFILFLFLFLSIFISDPEQPAGQLNVIMLEMNAIERKKFISAFGKAIGDSELAEAFSNALPYEVQNNVAFILFKARYQFCYKLNILSPYRIMPRVLDF